MNFFNLFKNYYFVTLTTQERGNVTYNEFKMVIRAFNGWVAFDIAKEEDREKGDNWLVYDMKRI